MVYTSGERVKEIVRIFTKYGLSYIVDKKNKKELEIEKEVNTEIKSEKEIEGNTSNITINNPIVLRYGDKKDVRTALYNVRVRRTPTDTEDNVIGVIKLQYG